MRERGTRTRSTWGLAGFLLVLVAALGAHAEPPSFTLPGRQPDSREPWGVFLGNAAHEAIGIEYTLQHPSNRVFLNTSSLSRIVKEGRLGDPERLAEFVRRLRPDITDTDARVLFEVKPDDEESRGEGREQAERYLAALNGAVDPDKKLVGGTGFEGSLFLEFENGGALCGEHSGSCPWRTPEPGVTLSGRVALEENLTTMVGPDAMTPEQSPVLEFPAWLHGTTAAILRKVRTEGKWWAREYLETGAFPQPRQMRQVAPGEVLVMHSGADFDLGRTGWWVHLFAEVFTHLDECIQKEERQRTEAAFESFCLSTPWGALYHAVSPPPPHGAARMANRLASLLRFWEVLQGPRYAFRFGKKYTLEELMEDLWRKTLEAWCPGGPAPVREQLALTVERMARATREECLEAVRRVMPAVAEMDTDLKHCELLREPGFLRERLSALPPKKFEELSSAYTYAVSGQLWDWYRELERH